MHRWYVKARYQEDHNERSAALGCEIVLEDTSPQVNPEDELPHVLIQVGRLGDDGEYTNQNLIFVEPVDKADLDAVPGDDPEPEGELPEEEE